jgi:hypothetical protein
MKLSQIQKVGLIFFAGTLILSYFIAQWRHDASHAAITEKFEREQRLNLSADKLLINCERNEEKEDNPYDANHQICVQGEQEHELAERTMRALAQENARNDVRGYRNFFLFALIFNLLGFAGYKATQFFKRDTDTNS